MKEHLFGVRKDLIEKMDLDVHDPPYNVQRDLKDDHAEYGVFSSNDMDEMTMVLTDVLKSRALGHVSSSAL